MPIDQKQPNIIIIVLDTHRRDRLGIYGYPRGTSPNIDAFAADATIFDQAIAPAQWTIPVHASMFSGEYPSTHLTTQSGHTLDSQFKTLAERMRPLGYRRIGFCNNPLVGVLDNGLKRGFETFYNYGGAVPSTPARSASNIIKPLAFIWERYTQLLRRISYPIQNAVARSDRVFQLTLHPLLVPLWTRYVNFKGDTDRSLHDVADYMQREFPSKIHQPHFLFVNLMETHLPYIPPENFVRQFAPNFFEARESRDFMRVYNTQALRWLLPMDEPFSDLETSTLSDLYDAEVAYQDHLLGKVLEILDSSYHRENSLVVLVADHGEMLGEHRFMGHGIGVHDELIRVPMAIRYPGQKKHRRVSEPVSTMQLFHTLLDYAGGELENDERPALPIDKMSLRRFAGPVPQGSGIAISEAYPPVNVLKIMEKRGEQTLIDEFSCRRIYWGVYNDRQHKLIKIENGPKMYYRLGDDPDEKQPLGSDPKFEPLDRALEGFREFTMARRPSMLKQRMLPLEDEKLRARLRGLGYLE